MVAKPGPTAKHTPALRAGARVTLDEAQAFLRELNAWILSQSTNYGADPQEAFDASNSLVEVKAWLEDLASRSVRIQL